MDEMRSECTQSYLLVIAIFSNSWLVTMAMPCNDRCSYTGGPDYHADCYNLGLTDIPLGCEDALTLEASRNDIREIRTSTFRGYDRLEYLYINNNKITSIAAGAFQPFATTLQSLDLGRNSLSRLDRSTFENMVNLNQLDLRWNQIVTIQSQAFNDMQNLTILLLSNNAINSLALDVFDGLVSLRSLHLDSNRLVQVNSRLFANLRSLLHLRLSNNSITSLDGEPLSLSPLRRINVSLNNISVFDCRWINQTSLDLLVDTSLNMIQNVVNCQSQVNKLILHGNPFNCSCENRDLADVFHAYTMGVSPTCSTPPGKRNMNITEKAFQDCYRTESPTGTDRTTRATTTQPTISEGLAVVTLSPIATEPNSEGRESTTLQEPLVTAGKERSLQNRQQASDILIYIVMAICFLALLAILLVAISIRLSCRKRSKCHQSYETGIQYDPHTTQTNPPSLPRRHIYQEIPGEQAEDQIDHNQNAIPMVYHGQNSDDQIHQNNNSRHLLLWQHLSDSQDSGLADQFQRNSFSEWYKNNVTYIPVESLSSGQTHPEQFQQHHPDPPRQPHPMPPQPQPVLHQPPHQSQHQPAQEQSHYVPHHQPQHQLPYQHHPQNQHYHQQQYQPKHQTQPHLNRGLLHGSTTQTLQNASPHKTCSAVKTEKRRRRSCSSCNCQTNKVPRECDQQRECARQPGPPSKPVLHTPSSRKGHKVTEHSSGYVSRGSIN